MTPEEQFDVWWETVKLSDDAKFDAIVRTYLREAFLAGLAAASAIDQMLKEDAPEPSVPEKNFLEVNCPKCGNRNTIIPPHECLAWKTPELSDPDCRCTAWKEGTGPWHERACPRFLDSDVGTVGSSEPSAQGCEHEVIQNPPGYACKKCWLRFVPMSKSSVQGWEAEFVEAGANIEHERWAAWQRHLHSKGHESSGYFLIPMAEIERWERQIATRYADLSEIEKESDRREARSYLPLIYSLLTKERHLGIRSGAHLLRTEQERVLGILEANRKETMFGDDASNEVAAIAIDNFVKASVAAIKGGEKTDV